MKHFIIFVLLAAVAAQSQAQSRAELSDHPLISRYEGASVQRKNVIEFDEYDAFTGMDDAGKEPTGIALEGKVTKILYKRPKERSILEVFRNYEIAIAQSGAEVLFKCNQEKRECADGYAGPTLQKFSDIQSVSNTSGRYLLARIEEAEFTAYIAIAVGQNFNDVHVIEVREMDTGMVTLDAAALGKGLDARGYVIVEGIYFDTDKASLKPQSEAALQQVAELLRSRSELQVYVVGHTDMQGSLAHNQSLSENRAKAVVDALANSYQIGRERMSGHGVGPLAPQATNSNDAGRAKNRRVVLVAR